MSKMIKSTGSKRVLDVLLMRMRGWLAKKWLVYECLVYECKVV